MTDKDQQEKIQGNQIKEDKLEEKEVVQIKMNHKNNKVEEKEVIQAKMINKTIKVREGKKMVQQALGMIETRGLVAE